MEKRNYTKFYALLKQRPSIDKDELVLQFTDGRTTHLTEMSNPEYNEMISALEESMAPSREEVNAFVSSPKIAGKVFYELSVDELKTLVRKLESIERKGGLRKPAPDPTQTFFLSYQPSNIVS